MNVTFKTWLLTTASRYVIANVTAKEVKKLYTTTHKGNQIL